MKKYLIGLVLLMVCVSGFAKKPMRPVLSMVTMQLGGQSWVTTNTAVVTVRISASLDKSGLAKLQNQVMSKLNKLVSGVDWHIVMFNRVKQASGLEQVRIQAQARVATKYLPPLRTKALQISKPGQTFTIANIQFRPSFAEFQRARAELRQRLYQQAKQELARLNKVYSGEKFVLYRINFIPEMMTGPQARPLMMMSGAAMPAAKSVDTSAQIMETAKVVFAAKLYK